MSSWKRKSMDNSDSNQNLVYQNIQVNPMGHSMMMESSNIYYPKYVNIYPAYSMNKIYIPSNVNSKQFNEKIIENAPTTKNIQLLLKYSKRFIKETKSVVNTLNSKEKTVKKQIYNYYFIQDNNKHHKVIFDNEYMLSFKTWRIANETKLLPETLISHLKQFDTFEEVSINNSSSNKLRSSQQRKNENKEMNRSSRAENTLEQWGRRDLTKEIELAEKFKQKLEILRKEDPIKFDLTELLNILAVDNYKPVKQIIFEKIKDSIENQSKFLDVLFKKAVHEKAFVFLYAKLCKELDKMLPQKDQQKNNKKPYSLMHSKLIDKCREVFKIDNNSKFDRCFKVNDPTEREIKLKKFVLGNVNFICELIKAQILSKKIVFPCIDNLLSRYEKEGQCDEILRLINLEAIVIIIDNFGTMIKKKEDTIKEEDKTEYNIRIDEYLRKLNDIQENSKLPGYVKYKIINLIEKKKNNWEESEYEKALIAKSKTEARNGNIGKVNEKKYTMDEIISKVFTDIKNFNEFINEGNSKEKYDWGTIEDIYENKNNSMKDILTAYIENCIDFIQDEKTLEVSKFYCEEIISFYGNTFTKEEKKKITDTMLNLLVNISDVITDNKLMIECFSNILYCFFENKIMNVRCISRMKGVAKNNKEIIKIILGNIISIDENYKNEIENVIINI